LSSKARKPYLGLKRSLTDFFRTPVRYLKESNVKESQFEKPYLGRDYRRMHFALPAPDWPTWKFDPDIAGGRRWSLQLPFGVNPSGDIEFDPNECPCCFLVRWNECGDGILSGGLWMGIWHRDEIPSGLLTNGHGEWVIEGAYKNVSEVVGLPLEGGAYGGSHRLWFEFDPDQSTLDGYTPVTLCYEIKGFCRHCVDYWAYCETCTCPSGDFAFDDASTPDTIAPGGSITMYVSGGCPPYNWSVSGTGYTLDKASTTGLSNGLNCASGT